VEKVQQTAPSGTGSVRRLRYASLAGLMLQQEKTASSLLAQRMFSVTETASALGLNPATIREWVKRGDLLGVRSGQKGHYRIPQSELARLKGVS
jgi:excisionase family DNA binding protein